MADGEKWLFDKLNAKNWTNWKFQMKHFLIAKGLWGFVDGSEELAIDANVQITADFRKKQQRAFSCMVMSIDSSQLYLNLDR